MIRQATSADLEVLCKLCLEKIKENNWKELSGATVDEDSVNAVVKYHIVHRDGFAYVNETGGVIDGVFLGCVMPWTLDLNYKAAHEKMGFGGNLDALWETFLQWAIEKNAITCVRSCFEVLEGQRFRRLR